MKKRLLYVTIFLISFMLVGIQPAFSQDDPALHEPGTVEGTARVIFYPTRPFDTYMVFGITSFGRLERTA